MSAATSKIKWTSEHINHLLHSMKGFRPYGVEKHFHMMFIVERFRARSGLNVTAEALWDYIEELYDIKTLSERDYEDLKRKPIEYSLPADLRPSNATTTLEPLARKPMR